MTLTSKTPQRPVGEPLAQLPATAQARADVGAGPLSSLDEAEAVSCLAPPVDVGDLPECFDQLGWSAVLCPGCVFAPWCSEPLPAPPPPVRPRK